MDAFAECAAHVRHVVETVPLDLANRHGGEQWTSRKVLRRLAGRERGDLVAMRGLALNVARARGLPPPAPAP